MKDNVIGTRLGVLLRSKGENITLDRLREDLSSRVDHHMLPNAFRMMTMDEQVPKTPTDKVSKGELVNAFFPYCKDKLSENRVELLEIEI